MRLLIAALRSLRSFSIWYMLAATLSRIFSMCPPLFSACCMRFVARVMVGLLMSCANVCREFRRGMPMLIWFASLWMCGLSVPKFFVFMVRMLCAIGVPPLTFSASARVNSRNRWFLSFCCCVSMVVWMMKGSVPMTMAMPMMK